MRVNNDDSTGTVSGHVHQQEAYHINDLKLENSPQALEETPKGGGTNWKLAVGTSVVAVLVPPLSLCHGLVAVQILKEFPGVSWTSITGWDALLLTTWSFMGPLTVILHKKFSSRVLACVGGLLLSTGLSLSFFSSMHFITVYIALGIMTGVGGSLSESTGGRVLKCYFNERRDMASRLCLLFRTLGQVAMPHCLSVLFILYNLRGGLLIMGALTLHVCAASLLFPKMEQPCNQQKESSNYTRQFLLKSINRPNSNHPIVKKKKKKKRKRKKSDGDKDETDDYAWKNPAKESRQMRNIRIRTFSLDSSRMLPDIPEEQEPIDDETDDDDADDDASNDNNEQVQQLLDGNQENGVIVSIPVTYANKRIRQESETSTVSFASSNDSHSSRVSLSTIYSDSSLSLYSDLGSTTSIDQLAIDDHEPMTILFKRAMRDPVLWLIMVSCTLHNLVNSNFLLYIPVQTDSQGMSTSELSCLLSLYVVGNVLGRLCTTWLYNISFQIPTICTTMGLFALVSISVLIFTEHMVAYYLCSLIFGCTSGGCNALVSPMVLHLIPFNYRSQAVSMLQVAQGFVFLLGITLIGLLYEKHQLCVYAFSVLVLFQGVSVAVWALLPLAEKLRNHQQNHETPDL